jgi:hypothetical protein
MRIICLEDERSPAAGKAILWQIILEKMVAGGENLLGFRPAGRSNAGVWNRR